jgi:hypothetical protein
MQATTVAGVTMARTSAQRDQTRDSRTQNARSTGRRRGRRSARIRPVAVEAPSSPRPGSRVCERLPASLPGSPRRANHHGDDVPFVQAGHRRIPAALRLPCARVLGKGGRRTHFWPRQVPSTVRAGEAVLTYQADGNVSSLEVDPLVPAPRSRSVCPTRSPTRRPRA